MGKAQKFSREAILADKRFHKYQKDFLRAVLKEPEYTIAQAEKAVRAFFMEKESD